MSSHLILPSPVTSNVTYAANYLLQQPIYTLNHPSYKFGYQPVLPLINHPYIVGTNAAYGYLLPQGQIHPAYQPPILPPTNQLSHFVDQLITQRNESVQR